MRANPPSEPGSPARTRRGRRAARHRIAGVVVATVLTTLTAGSALALTPPQPPPPSGPVGVPTSTTTTPTTTTTIAPPPPSIAETMPETTVEVPAPSSTEQPTVPPAPPPPPATDALEQPNEVVALEIEADEVCVWDAVDDYYTVAAGDVLEPDAMSDVRMNDTACNPQGGSGFGFRAFDPSHGTLEMDWGDFRYTPDANFTGLDTFTYEYFPGDDPSAVLASATVHILVSDCTAFAQSDSYAVEQNTELVTVAPGLFSNDGLGCAPLTLTHTQPGHGSVSVEQDGSMHYTPTADFVGEDMFLYELRDASDAVLANSSVRIDVSAGPPCTVADDSYATTVNMPLVVPPAGVLTNDFVCPDFAVVTADIFSGGTPPEHGTLTLDETDGSFTYVPEPAYIGLDQFTYAMFWYKFGDEYQRVERAVVTIDVIAPPPCSNVFVDDMYEVAPDTELVVAAPGPGSNDTVCPGHHLVLADPPGNGIVTLAGDGDMTYTPTPGFVGIDTFTYTMVGGPAEFAAFRAPPIPDERTATVTINVTQTPAPTTTSTSTTTTVPDSTPSTVPPPSGELPRTGSSSTGVVAALGLALMLAGTCLIVAMGRRSR